MAHCNGAAPLLYRRYTSGAESGSYAASALCRDRSVRRRRADVVAGWTELSREHRVRVHGIASGLRRSVRCLPDSDRGRRSGRRFEWDFRHTRCRGTGDCRVQCYTRRDPASACGGLGRRSCGFDAGSRRLERWRRRRRGARPPRESRLRRRWSDRRPSRWRGLEHRIIVGAGGSGGAGGAIGGPIGTGGGNGGDLIGHEGFAVLGSANPATGGKGGTQAAGGDPGRNASDLLVTATAGSLGLGGNGAAGFASGGGGGGGGLYGGGGGGSSSTFSGGHGGGGSGFGPAGASLPSRCRRWLRARDDQLRPRHPLLGGSRDAKADV